MLAKRKHKRTVPLCFASQFAFVRNLQGDVIAMIDQNGETVMEYSYDPWGKIEYHLSDESLTEEDAALITALCPLTYRGYNYDFTTGLYYLQSRYYNPEWGRFLNCDDTNILLATQGETHNANLFAYCDNNPVNKVDYTGYDAGEIANIFIFDILLPLLGLYDRLLKLGYEHYFDIAQDITCSYGVDSKNNFKTYTVLFILSKDKYSESSILVSYIYGAYNDWEVYINKINKNVWLKIVASPFTGIALGIVGAFVNPVVSIAISIGAGAASWSAGKKKSFAKTSKAVLDNTKGMYEYYGFIETIVRSVNGVGASSGRVIYMGDDSIYGVA